MCSQRFLRHLRRCFSRMARCRGSDHGAPPHYPSNGKKPRMTETFRRRMQQARIYALIGAVSVAAFSLLAFREWYIPAPFPSRFWNALAAFAILGIVSESFSF